MWLIENQTPYPADRTWVRDVDGVHHWIVAVKATYDIAEDGTTTLSEEPVEPLLAPEYRGDDGESSLLYEADLVAMKPGTDLLLSATAHAPRGRPATEVPVMLRVGGRQKVLVVRGDRTWRRTLLGEVAPSDPAPFVTMPIVYERAFGGYDRTDPDPAKHRMDFRNPVGVGLAAKRSHLIGQPAPNIEYPDGDVRRAGPAGFGPIASWWSPRRELQGTYDEAWQKNRLPLLPLDYDPMSLLCAPADQRPERRYLRGGELVELVNLTPSGALRFELPQVYLTFETFFGRASRQHRSKLVTVVVEPDHPRVILVWQTDLEVRGDVDYLDKTVVRQKEYRDL